MKNDKKSFIIYQSWEDSFNLLNCEEQSQFIKNLFMFHRGEEPILNTPMLSIFWKSIEYNLYENDKRYKTSVENGKKGGAPKGNNNAKRQPENNLQSTQEQPTYNLKGSIDKQPTINLYKDKDKDKDSYKDLYSYKDVNNDFLEIDITEGVNDDLFEDWLKTKQVL
jgi:hypothetical protein